MANRQKKMILDLIICLGLNKIISLMKHWFGNPRTSTCTVIEVVKIDQLCIIHQLVYTTNIDANENRKLVN